MFNANNNHSLPQTGVSVNLGDVTVGLEVARNYQRIGLGDEPSKWETIRRKAISVYDIVHARKDLYGGANLESPWNNWNYTQGTESSDKLRATSIPFTDPSFSTSEVWGDAVMVVHCWGPQATKLDKKSREIFEARKRALRMKNGTTINKPAGKSAYLHSASVSFYDYNEALPEVCRPLHKYLCKAQVTLEGGTTVDQNTVDCMRYMFVPNAFVDEMGAEYKDTGLADGFVVGVIIGTKIQLAGGIPQRGDELKLFCIQQGKYSIGTDYSNWINAEGEISNFRMNTISYRVSKDFTTAHFPWLVPDHNKFGGFTDQLAMHTQGLLMQSAPVSMVKHGSLPSDVLPNYYKIKLYAVDASDNKTLVNEFTTEGSFDAPATDSLWVQSINEMDIKLPDSTVKIFAEVQGLGWFTNIPEAELTAADKSNRTAVTTLSSCPFATEKFVTVPVEMPIKIQLDVRYA